MDDDEGRSGDTPAPAVLHRRPPLTSDERRRALLAGLLPVPVAALLLTPFALWGPATAGDVVGAAIVYGGLLGLAAGFVYVDRVHGRQCPRCGARAVRGSGTCGTCGYDLELRPRYSCDQRHAIYLDPGLCECGRRLQPLPVARGVGREITLMLKIGAWLLAFLLGMGFLLQMAGPAGG
ncbi:MAG: hypothetical protein KY461_10565 [Actinobacteria bacterium]|nr:hypothetical protein [Actinomycetota bacterium]